MALELNHHREGSGEPLVLVHGIGSLWQMWEPVIGLLADHHDVIAVDLPGFAGSPMPTPPATPGIDTQIRLLGEFLSGLGVERPHVAGNSMGGLIVLEMARRDLVASCTALSPAGFANRAETLRARSTLRIGVRLARRFAPHAGRLMASRMGRRLALRAGYGRPGDLTPRQAADSIRALAGAAWFDATLPMIGPMEFGPADRMRAPVTLAWGKQDRLLPPRQARRAGRLIPDADVRLLRGCGHVPTFDEPRLVARVILETAARGAARPVAGGSPAAHPAAGQAPVATGREGSETHSLQDPG